MGFRVRAALLTALMSVAAPAAAQSPLPIAVEARVDGAFPTGGDFAEHASSAVGFGLSAALQLVPNYGLYVGYGRTRFELDLPGVRAVDSGFSIGLTAAYPGLLGFTPWLGSGIVLRTLELEGSQLGNGGRGVGFEVGGGVAVPVAPRVRLTPGVGYRRYTARFVHGEDEPISYLTLGAGVNVAL